MCANQIAARSRRSEATSGVRPLRADKLPNDLAFETYSIKSMSGIVAAPEQAGIGFGKQGATLGKLYTFAPPPAAAVSTIRNNSPS